MLKLVIIAVCLVIAALSFFRLYPVDTKAMNVDPFGVQPPNKPNYYITSLEEGTFDIPAEELVEKLRTVLAKTARTNRISRNYYPADSDEFYGATFVTRTRLMGYPDYTSIKVVKTSPTTSQMMMFGRARFGYSDLGVNKQRILGWLAALRRDV